MEQVKVFHTCDPQRLEQELNVWIDEVSPNIKRAVQTSTDGGTITMTIFYENTVGTDLPLSDPGPNCKCAACYTV